MDLGGKRSNRFSRVSGVVLAAGLAGLLGACAGGSGPEDTFNQITRVDYGRPYIGMSKAEVLKCAGNPRSRIPAGASAETLVYRYNGAGPVPLSDGGGKEQKKKKLFAETQKSADGDCTATLTFEKDKLVRVSYAHKDSRSPYQWQSEKNEEKAEAMRREGVPTCKFSLPRCPR